MPQASPGLGVQAARTRLSRVATVMGHNRTAVRRRAGFWSSYSNYKYVSIYDPTLGLLFRIATLLPVVYVVVYLLVIQKGYLQLDPIVGTVEFHVKRKVWPTQEQVQSLPYCESSDDTGENHCVLWDEFDVVYPPSVTSSLFMTVNVKDRHQTRPNATSPFSKGREHKYYVAGVEDMHVRLAHTYTVPQMYAAAMASGDVSHADMRYSGSQRRMRGHLTFLDNREPHALHKAKADVFPVKTLLAAAGVSLDMRSDRVNLKEVKKTFRDRGLIMLVTIEYQNYQNTWFGTHDTEYSISVRRLHESESKEYESLFLSGDTLVVDGQGRASRTDALERIMRKRYGIRVFFAQTGKIGTFSIGAVLSQLVAVAGLMAVGSSAVEFFALYLSPQAAAYTKCTIDEYAAEEELDREFLNQFPPPRSKRQLSRAPSGAVIIENDGTDGNNSSSSSSNCGNDDGADSSPVSAQTPKVPKMPALRRRTGGSGGHANED
jgi:ATP P2X receptor